MTQSVSKPADSSAQAKALADGWAQDDALARAKGATPEQVAARQRVARQFCDMHFVGESPDALAGRLALIDYTAQISVVNGRSVDMQNPKAKGFLGMGRKAAYLASTRFPPQKPEDPIYALEYFPLKA